MNQNVEVEARVPEDRFVAVIFTLADHAFGSSEDGKLYIHGAGVGTVMIPAVPGSLPALHLAMRLRIPWHKMTEPFTLQIRALNADRTPVNQDPLMELKPEVGRPPGYRPGDEACMNLSLGIGGMPVREFGTIYFHLEVDGDQIAVQPLKIVPSQILRLSAPGQ